MNMNNENRKEWAVLPDDCAKLAKGEEITIGVVYSRAGHGGGYLETKSEKIKVSKIKELAPNMLIVQANETDYYMYNYNLSGLNVVFPTDKHWSIDTELKIGKQIRFTRSIKRNGFEEKTFTGYSQKNYILIGNYLRVGISFALKFI